MTLDILQKEMILALKNKDKIRKETISDIIGAIKKAAIDQKCKDNITEELVNTVLLKEQKAYQEMIDTCPVDRADTLRGYRIQADIINEFAPSLMRDIDEIRVVVLDILKNKNIEIVPANRGIIMKTLSAELKSKADMKIVSQAVGEIFK